MKKDDGGNGLLQSINVLAVDDQPANLVALEAVLAAECNFLTAHSGEEALALLRERPEIDVVLMDIQMPRMDGYEAARRAKALPGCDDLPIIFISAVYTEEPFVRKGYEAGAVDYFARPFDPTILRRKVAAYGSYRRRLEILKQRERQVYESQQLVAAGLKLASLVGGLPVGVLISDETGRIRQVNDAASGIFQAPGLVDHDEYADLLPFWTPRGRIENELHKITCFDGSGRTILASASPLFGASGEITGAVMVVQDVTEPARIKEEFEQRISTLSATKADLEQTLPVPDGRRL
jgi:CheY-like chemotaxis protein